MENDLISRGTVLELLENIKMNPDAPKNYGTLLDIMREENQIVKDGFYSEEEAAEWLEEVYGVKHEPKAQLNLSEQVKELRKVAELYMPSHKILIRRAADTIESLSAKLQAANMEQAADCDGWIECESGKLPDKEVICCDVCGEIIIGYIHETYESEQTGFSAENSHEYMYNCTKWMEKPKP